MRSTRRLAVLLASSALAGTVSLTWAPAALPAAWTPVHPVSAPGLGGVLPQATLFRGHTTPYHGHQLTSARAIWASGGVIRASEHPATLGAWAPSEAISAAGASDPLLAGDVAVWLGSGDGGPAVQSAAHGDAGWSAPQDVSAPGATAPVITPTFAGLLAAWTREVSGDAVAEVAQRTSATGAWGEPVVLSEPGGDVAGVRVYARNPADGAVAVWARSAGGEQRIHAVFRSGHTGTWTAPVDVSPVGQAAHDPQVVVTPSGRVVVIWIVGSGAGATVHSSNLASEAMAWSAPVALSPAGVSAVSMVAWTGAIVAWQRPDGAGSLVESTVLADDTGAWADPARISPEGEAAEEPVLLGGEPIRAARRCPGEDGVAVE